MKTLKYMPYAQAHVISDGHRIGLISYKTLVATLEDNVLVIYGLFSSTTRKHIKAFVKEYIPFEMDFQSIKYLANHMVGLDISTGEVLDMAEI